MRYVIMDAMLDYGSMFFLGFLITYLAHCVYETLCAWWTEGKTDLKVQELEKDDLRLEEIKAWRG
jgi:hypothetical protein